MEITKTQKRCSRCKLIKSRAKDFNKDRCNKDGLDVICKDCKRIANREYHKERKALKGTFISIRNIRRKQRIQNKMATVVCMNEDLGSNPIEYYKAAGYYLLALDIGHAIDTTKEEVA